MKNVLLIANPKAGTTGDGLIQKVRAGLAGEVRLEISETSERGDATRLAADAVAAGIDAVVAFGGDGTVNEVAQALVHSDSALGIIPAGTTNVMARSVGIPDDVSAASALLASRLGAGESRRINVGRIGERYFLFGAGMGLDAEVIRSVEARPERKRRLGHFFFLQQALATAARYRGADPRIEVTVDGVDQGRFLLALIANTGPFTYFGRHPLHVFPDVQLRKGLDVFALSRIGRGTVPRLAWSFFVTRSHLRWAHSNYHHDINSVELRAVSPLPVEVDGDYIGEWDRATITLIPQALKLLV
jgi:diacylglycerol kinase family enzyme